MSIWSTSHAYNLFNCYDDWYNHYISKVIQEPGEDTIAEAKAYFNEIENTISNFKKLSEEKHAYKVKELNDSYSTKLAPPLFDSYKEWYDNWKQTMCDEPSAETKAYARGWYASADWHFSNARTSR